MLPSQRCCNQGGGQIMPTILLATPSLIFRPHADPASSSQLAERQMECKADYQEIPQLLPFDVIFFNLFN